MSVNAVMERQEMTVVVPGFARAKRPEVDVRHGFPAALRATISNGDAIVIPLNGETYEVMRNRKAGRGSAIAKPLNCSVRTARSKDGLSVLMWLEPKETV